MIIAAWLWACGSPEPDRYPLTGEVVEVRDDTLVVAHDAIDGFMGAMVMTLPVDDPTVLDGMKAGDRISATLSVGRGTHLQAVAVVTPAPRVPDEAPPELAPGQAVPVGALFPTTPIPVAPRGHVTLGVGQTGAMAVTFIYTRCPIPEFCPLVVSRMAALQEALPPEARILAITLDPAHDSRKVLADYAATSGARAGTWDFGRLPEEILFGLAEKSGLVVHGRGLGISHDLVLMILDPQGRLVARYTDMDWDLQEVVALLGSDP